MAQNYRAVPKPGKIIKSSKPPRIKVVTRQPVQAKNKQAQTKHVTKAKHAINPPKKAQKINKTQTQQQHQVSKQQRIRQEVLDKKQRRTPYNPTKDISVNKINKLKNLGVGKILVMMACGPSINEVDFEPLFGNPRIDLMCINKPDPRTWPHVAYWAFCDQSQYNRNTDLFFNCNKMILNSTAVKARRAEKQVVIKSIGGNGFSRDLTRGYHIGRSTVYANMQTALWMNYDQIYIFGIDMCEVEGKVHFYGINPDVKPVDRVKRFKIEADNYLKAYHIMKEEERIKFTICSGYNNWEFAELYGKINHKQAVNIILNEANK